VTQAAQLQQLALQLMAEHYPHIQVHRLEIIQAGGIKTIWKLETSLGKVCLKRIRKSIPIVRFTTAAQAYLSSKGALVARIIPTKNGLLYFVHEGYALVLYSWINGTDLEMEENLEHLRAGIAGLAQFQKASVGFQPPEDCEIYDRMGLWPHHYTKMIEELEQWKDESEQQSSEFHQTFARAALDIIAMAKQALQLLQASCYDEWVQSIGKYGYLIHQDYGKGNALRTSKGVYVLDLDNLAYDLPIRDLRKLITKRMEELERWDPGELQEHIRCFEAVLPFTDEQRHVLYIDFLFPHAFYGEAKNPFKKGDLERETEKIEEAYQFEMEKWAVLKQLL
jgi:spore coat protein I